MADWCPFAIRDHAAYINGSITPKYIVIHETEGFPAGDLETLREGGDHHVSVHFLIQPDGALYQFMPIYRGANHAGGSTNGMARTIGRPNEYAIGIELSHPPAGGNYPDVQLTKLDGLLTWLDSQLGKLPLTRHKDINPNKTDPRDPFPWGAYLGSRNHKGAVVDDTDAPELLTVSIRPSKNKALGITRQLSDAGITWNIADEKLAAVPEKETRRRIVYAGTAGADAFNKG